MFVDDVVDANLRAAESEATGPINIGLGQEKSVLDIAGVLSALVEDGFQPETPRSARARCSTSPSTPRARVKRSAGRPGSSSTRA